MYGLDSRGHISLSGAGLILVPAALVLGLSFIAAGIAVLTGHNNACKSILKYSSRAFLGTLVATIVTSFIGALISELVIIEALAVIKGVTGGISALMLQLAIPEREYFGICEDN